MPFMPSPSLPVIDTFATHVSAPIEISRGEVDDAGAIASAPVLDFFIDFFFPAAIASVRL